MMTLMPTLALPLTLLIKGRPNPIFPKISPTRRAVILLSPCSAEDQLFLSGGPRHFLHSKILLHCQAYRGLCPGSAGSDSTPLVSWLRDSQSRPEPPWLTLRSLHADRVSVCCLSAHSGVEERCLEPQLPTSIHREAQNSYRLPCSQTQERTRG